MEPPSESAWQTKLRLDLTDRTNGRTCLAVHGDIDPAVGFTALYMQFFNYFLVEKLFGGNRHFGLSDEQVIKQLTDMYCRGLLTNGSRPKKTRKSRKH